MSEKIPETRAESELVSPPSLESERLLEEGGKENPPRRLSTRLSSLIRPGSPGMDNQGNQGNQGHVPAAAAPPQQQQQQQQQQPTEPNPDAPPAPPPRRRFPNLLADVDPAEMKHFIEQIYAITLPVLLCITLTIWWVKVREYWIPESAASPFNYVTIEGDTTEAQIEQSVINALIIIGCIVVMTIIFVVLFWFGFHKVIIVVLVGTVILTLGGQGGLFVWYETQAVNVAIDWITFSFVIWNFTIVGLWVIFKSGPLYIQQAYLIVLSALMAFVFTQIDEWTTWLLLGFLVIWDLLAVLTPCGPLKLLIEASQRQDVEIPALLYSVTMIFFMADVPSAAEEKRVSRGEDEGKKEKKEKRSSRGDDGKKKKKKKKRSSHAKDKDHQSDDEEEDDHAEERGTELTHMASASAPVSAATVPTQRSSATPTQLVQQQLAGQDLENQNRAIQAQAEAQADDDDEPRGLKLGLGDFVFYSVLVGRAALTDWTTIFTCTVAVLTGLTGTILLLAIFQKALPALPISLTIGLIFYFLTSLVVAPFNDLLQKNLIFV